MGQSSEHRTLLLKAVKAGCRWTGANCVPVRYSIRFIEGVREGGCVIRDATVRERLACVRRSLPYGRVSEKTRSHTFLQRQLRIP